MALGSLCSKIKTAEGIGLTLTENTHMVDLILLWAFFNTKKRTDPKFSGLSWETHKYFLRPHEGQFSQGIRSQFILTAVFVHD